MTILDDLTSQLTMNAPVRDIRQGVFHTAVVTQDCGLAATLPKDALRQPPPMVAEPGSLLKKSAGELVKLAYSPRILEAAIGMAAINSLLDVDMEACLELNAADLIMEKGRGKQVAIVGHFPFIPRIRETARRVWVIEKNPQDDDLGEDAAGSVIPEADVVAITGTSLTHHTLEGLLGLRRPDAFVVLLGDTAPLSSVLLDYGVDAVSGTRVVDPELVLQCVSQGANFRQIKGVRRLTMMR